MTEFSLFPLVYVEGGPHAGVYSGVSRVVDLHRVHPENISQFTIDNQPEVNEEDFYKSLRRQSCLKYWS